MIVRDKQVLATGYVGSPAGLPHCDDVGHLMKKVIQENGEISEHCLRTVHSEQNAICQAAKRGISIEGATIYTRMTPCRTCAMLLINCGIQRVVSPILNHWMRCRFYPTCSEYAILSIRKYGLKLGIKKTYHRLLRCRPDNLESCLDFP